VFAIVDSRFGCSGETLSEGDNTQFDIARFIEEGGSTMSARLFCILFPLCTLANTACNNKNALPTFPCSSQAPSEAIPCEMARAAIEPPKPILEGYTADPHAVVFDDTYYVYPTSDKGEWQTTDFSAWSSKDLVHWTNEGVILDVTKDLQWAKIRGWAPAMIRRDGKYFFYFAAEQKIGVAVSDKPTGKFVDALGRPLITASKPYPGQTIDPFAFIDDDGEAYLYYGQANLYVNRLARDMITLAGAPTEITPRHFNEGVFMIKRNGIYYFMWSQNDARDINYEVAYGTATSPLGPITVPPDNVILQRSGRALGTGHHSVIQVPGTDRWYIFYHRHAVPNGSGYSRETCLSPMAFEPDGRIKKVDPLTAAFPDDSETGEAPTSEAGTPILPVVHEGVR
jgi:beta-xylosidase